MFSNDVSCTNIPDIAEDSSPIKVSAPVCTYIYSSSFESDCLVNVHQLQMMMLHKLLIWNSNNK